MDCVWSEKEGEIIDRMKNYHTMNLIGQSRIQDQCFLDPQWNNNHQQRFVKDLNQWTHS
jgi:hypothetical protein